MVKSEKKEKTPILGIFSIDYLLIFSYFLLLRLVKTAIITVTKAKLIPVKTKDNQLVSSLVVVVFVGVGEGEGEGEGDSLTG